MRTFGKILAVILIIATGVTGIGYGVVHTLRIGAERKLAEAAELISAADEVSAAEVETEIEAEAEAEVIFNDPASEQAAEARQAEIDYYTMYGTDADYIALYEEYNKNNIINDNWRFSKASARLWKDSISVPFTNYVEKDQKYTAGDTDKIQSEEELMQAIAQEPPMLDQVLQMMFYYMELPHYEDTTVGQLPGNRFVPDALKAIDDAQSLDSHPYGYEVFMTRDTEANVWRPTEAYKITAGKTIAFLLTRAELTGIEKKTSKVNFHSTMAAEDVLNRPVASKVSDEGYFLLYVLKTEDKNMGTDKGYTLEFGFNLGDKRIALFGEKEAKKSTPSIKTKPTQQQQAVGVATSTVQTNPNNPNPDPGPGPGPTPKPKDKKDPTKDPVNNNEADEGGGQGGNQGDTWQPTAPTQPDPSTVVPPTPAQDPGSPTDVVNTNENPMDYSSQVTPEETTNIDTTWVDPNGTVTVIDGGSADNGVHVTTGKISPDVP